MNVEIHAVYTAHLEEILKKEGELRKVLMELYASHEALVQEKNKRYGNAALEPLGIFSKLGATNSIAVRLDDKLSRIKNASALRKNDVSDLIGYLMLLSLSQGWTDFSDQID